MFEVPLDRLEEYDPKPWNQIMEALTRDSSPLIRRWALASRFLAGTIPREEMEPVVVEVCRDPDPEIRAMFLRTCSGAPASWLHAMALEASRAPEACLRHAATQIWFSMLKPVRKPRPTNEEDIKIELGRLAQDPDPKVREGAQWNFYINAEVAPMDLGTWVSTDNTTYMITTSLNLNLWNPALETDFLRIALSPIMDGIAESERELQRFCAEEAPNERFEPLEDEHLKLWGALYRFRALVTAPPEDQVRMGRLILQQGHRRLRQAGAALLGLAGEIGLVHLQPLAGDPDPERARLGRLGLACSSLTEGRERLRTMLVSSDPTVLEEALDALTWRSTWDPSSCAALLRLPGRRLGDCSAEPDHFQVPRQWWRDYPVADLQATGQEAEAWLLPNSALPEAPVGLLPSAHCYCRALMALARSGDAPCRQAALNALWWNRWPHHASVFDAFFGEFIQDPDPGVRCQTMQGLVHEESDLGLFLSRPLDRDPEVLETLVQHLAFTFFDYAPREYPGSSAARELLLRIAREDQGRPGLIALSRLLGGMDAKGRDTWLPGLRQALEQPDLWWSVIDLLSRVSIVGFEEVCETACRGLIDGKDPWLEEEPSAYASRECLGRLLDRLADLEPGRWARVLDLLIEHPDIAWVKLAVEKVESHPLPEGIQALRALLARGCLLRRASRALGWLGTSESLETLRLLAASTDPFLRRLGAVGLGHHSDHQALRILKGLIEDPIRSVRCRAIRCLGYRKEPEAEARLLEYLKATDPRVRRAALGAILALPAEPAGHLVAWAWNHMGLTRENLLEPMFGKGGEHAVRAFLLEEVKRGAIVLAYR